jgi:amino acid permease
MMGSTLISIPYFISQAGIIPSIIILYLYGSICFYTARIIVKTGGKDNDYADTVYRYFGKVGNIGKVLQIVFNLSINIGATFIYFVIINQNLFPCIAVFLNFVFKCDIKSDDITPYFNKFSIIYCAIGICILIFPLLIRREMGILVKINSYGIYFVLVLIFFVFYIGIKGLITTQYKFAYIENKDNTEPRYLYLFGPNPSKLAGGACLGLFAHSVILPLLQNNENQENNQRDLFIGYLLVIFTYIAFGIIGYIGFSAKNFDHNFHDNWFRFFKPDDIVILFLRLLNVIQLLSIFPILFYVIRIQFFGIFFENNFPSSLHIIIFSLILIILCLLILYFFYESLSSLISNIGAGTGLFLIFLIPTIVNIIYYKRKHPHNLTELQENLINEKDDENNDINQVIKKDINDIDNYGISKKPKNKCKENLFYVSQILIMIFGVFTFIIQFVNINFFNIKIKKQ